MYCTCKAFVISLGYYNLLFLLFFISPYFLVRPFLLILRGLGIANAVVFGTSLCVWAAVFINEFKNELVLNYITSINGRKPPILCSSEVWIQPKINKQTRFRNLICGLRFMIIDEKQANSKLLIRINIPTNYPSNLINDYQGDSWLRAGSQTCPGRRSRLSSKDMLHCYHW